MRKLTMLALIVLVCAGSIFASLQPAYAVGKYVLTFWRECGAYENQAPPAGSFGNHSCYIHVWNENGTPRANVPIYTSWGVFLGNTNANGYTEVALYRPNGYDFQVRDGSNLSDTSPEFNQERAPNWGHYSYEVGFMYKSDSGNPGAFDLSSDGTLNISTAQPCDLDAPRTRSLAYYSTIPTQYCSDAYSLGNGSNSFGQTFVATGNRIVAARCHATIGSGGHLWYSAQIYAGGPNGAPIGPAATSREVVSDEYSAVILSWPITGVPVIPGQTYYIKYTRLYGTGFNVYHVNSNNYASGQYYENDVAIPGIDLEGIVVCGNVPENGRITGNVKDSLNRNIVGATVTTNTGGYTATTDSSGNYLMLNIIPGTYDVTASKSGYTSQTISDQPLAANSTATVNLTLTDASAPSTPSVIDDGVYTSNLTSLHARWSATDSQSGIAEYSYAIGTSAGASDVIGWTSAGLSFAVTKDVDLTPGVKYYFSVKAKNGAGLWSSVGSSDGIIAAEVVSSIADAKGKADDAAVVISQSVISRKDASAFWIQDSNRTSGIKVSGTTTAVEGNKLDVIGVLKTEAGERYLGNPQISNITSGAAVEPFAISGGALAGKPLGGYTPGVENALGPNNVGLLVTCWGEASPGGNGYFNISDGGKQIKVACGSLGKPTDGNYVIVTGISSLEPDGLTFKPVLRVFKQGDIRVISRT